MLTPALLLVLACIPGLDAPRAHDVPGVWRVVAADVDGDRYPDVVTSEQFGVHISYGRGETLATPVAVLEGQGHRWHLADVDGDGRPDFVVTRHEADDSVTFLLRNLGSRRFGAPEPVARTARAEVQAVLDFTGDGSPDLLIPRGELPALLAVNDGRGHFTVRETAVIPQAIRAAGDLDGDGDGDLILHASGPRVSIVRSNGNGDFAAPETRTFPTSMTPVLADLDSDGRSDLLALLGWGQIEIYPGAAAQPSSKIVYAGAPRTVVTADFNGDGAMDVAIYSETSTEPDETASSAPRLLIYLSDGRGGYVRAPDVLVGLWQVWVPADRVAAADFNRDGAVDLVVPAGERSVALVFGNGDGTFDAPRLVQAIRNHSLAMAADLDGDGVDELITRRMMPLSQSYSGRLSVGWLTADGTYAFEELPSHLFAFGEMPQLAIGDPNERGTRTILTTGSERLRVFSRTAPGIWEETASLPIGNALALAAADGRLLAVVADAAGVAHLRVYDAGGNLLHSLALGSRSSGYALAVAELTGDANQDVVVVRGGSWAPIHHDPDPLDGYLAILPGRGDGTYDAPRRLLDATRPGTPLPGDYNGDGRTDIVSGARLLSGDGRGNFTVSTLPFHADLAADVNGDGITDILSSLSLWQGTRTGFVHRGTYMFGSTLQGLAIVRRAANGPLTLLGVVDYAGELIAADFTCAAARRRTARP